jgi:hypothetical protein
MPTLADLMVQRGRTMASVRAACLGFRNQGTRGAELRDRARLQAVGIDLRNSILFRLAFAVVSAFDYFGKLVGLVYHGVGQRKLKWKLLTQYARNADLERRRTGSSGIHDSATAIAALALHADWFAELTEYRADAIHYRADEVGAI